VLVAEAIGGEIVGCDALQLYRGFDAATAKPNPTQRLRVPHHLVDVADPRRDVHLAAWVRAAEAAVTDISRRGKVPIVVGGTGMYLRGLLRGVAPAPPRDERLRARLLRMAARFGADRLHRWLAGLDPPSAARLRPGDTQRVIRGLELALSGSRWSDLLSAEAGWSSGRERYRAIKVGLDLGREELGRRLDERVDAFFEAGLVDEVRTLLGAGVPPGANAFKAIGYREVLNAIQAGTDPSAVRDAVKRATRRYAKRQRTWFRTEPGMIWLDAAKGPDSLAATIVELWRRDEG
jgi:tRNA dimethylallyltransferase